MRNFAALVTAVFCLLPHAAWSADDAATKITIDQIRSDSSILVGARLVSTGQPDEEILAAARQAGFVAVIDMRTESEDRGIDEQAAVEAQGMKYLLLPVSGADDVTFDNAAALDDMLAGIDGPVLMLCASGNRVGALIALRASLHGADAESALEAGKAAGLTRLEPVVADRLQEK